MKQPNTPCRTHPLLLVVFFLLVTGILPLSAQFFPLDTVEFHIDEQMLSRGDTFSVWMKTAQPMRLSGIQFGLAYDSSEVNIFDVSSPSIRKGDIRTKYDKNTHKFFIYNNAGDVLSIKGEWLQIQLHSKVSGLLSAYLKWDRMFQSTVVDENLDNFPLKISIGSITTSTGSFSSKQLAAYLYPNPVRGALYIYSEQIQTPWIDLGIWTMDGRQVGTFKGLAVHEGQYVFPEVQYLKPGSYLVNLSGQWMRLEKE